MGFAEEAKRVQSGDAPVPPAPPVGAAEVKGEPTMGFPKDGQSIQEFEAAKATQVPPAEKSEAQTPNEKEVQAPEKQGKTNFIIGDKEFETQEAALKYAQELALSKVADDAYREGVEAGKPPAEGLGIDPVQEFMKKIGDKLFDDPASALAEFAEHIKQSTQNGISVEQVRVEEEKSMWNGYFEANPDVAEFQDWFKQYTLTQLPKYGKMQGGKALQEIGKGFRSMLKIRTDALKPKTELGEVSTAVVPASGNPTPPVEKSLGETLDFVSAVRKHGRRELKKAR